MCTSFVYQLKKRHLWYKDCTLKFAGHKSVCSLNLPLCCSGTLLLVAFDVFCVVQNLLQVLMSASVPLFFSSPPLMSCPPLSVGPWAPFAHASVAMIQCPFLCNGEVLEIAGDPRCVLREAVHLFNALNVLIVLRCSREWIQSNPQDLNCLWSPLPECAGGSGLFLDLLSAVWFEQDIGGGQTFPAGAV